MGKRGHLPIYDIAMMISLGASFTMMTQHINEEYKSYYKGKPISKNAIKKIVKYLWGSFYDAQEQLFRPVIKDLVRDDYSLKEIYLKLRSADILKSWCANFFIEI